MPLSQTIIDATLRAPHGEAAYRIVERLTDAGFDTWWVGGPVRDMLEGTVPRDIDIATAAHPEDVLRHFPGATIAEGALGSTRVREGRFLFEVTTFRRESAEAVGRKPVEVQFGTREEDAARRDLTINALYVQPVSRDLYDPYGGEADLQERLIRFIGEPGERIRHDPLRSLRAVRMRARIRGQYHPDTFRALHEHAALPATLSGTRLLEEVEKLLLYPHPETGLEDLWELDILEHMLPELHRCKGVAQPKDYHHEGDVWNHLLQCVAAFREEDLLDVRIATLFHDVGKAETFSLEERIRFDKHAEVSAQMTDALLKRWGMNAKRREKISWLIAHHMMMGPLPEMPDDRKAHWYHHPWFEDLLRLFRLDIAGTTPSDYALYDRIVADRHRFLDAHPLPLRPLLTGKRVMELTGLQPSARVGEILELLREQQSSGAITTRREAEAFVQSLETAS